MAENEKTDGVELLMQQHQHLRELFDAVDAAAGRAAMGRD